MGNRKRGLGIEKNLPQNNCSLTLFVFTVLVVCFLFYEVSSAERSNMLNIEAAEIYVEIYPRDGYLHIKEYFISTLEPETHRTSQTERVKGLVKDAKYSKTRFGLGRFTAIEEKMFVDRGFVIGEYHLLTRETDMKFILDAAFSDLLGRKVNITVEEDVIGLHYSGDDITVRDNNAKGVFARGEKRVIFWDKDLKSFEAVFAPSGKQQDDFISVVPYFGEDVASPKWSQEEIEAWRSE